LIFPHFHQSKNREKGHLDGLQGLKGEKAFDYSEFGVFAGTANTPPKRRFENLEKHDSAITIKSHLIKSAIVPT